MPAHLARSPSRVRPSISRRDLIPELGIATGSVSATSVVYWLLFVHWSDSSGLLLFAAMAATLTFWRGLGPGMVASSLGSTVGPSLHALSLNQAVEQNGTLQLQTFILCAGSLITCWLIYRVRAEQEEAQVIQSRRDAALAFASHELRQPLSNIMLITGILERDPSEEMRNRAMGVITRSTARMATVIDELSDVTRLQDNTINVVPTVLRLQDVILAATDTVRPVVEQRQQSFEVDVPLGPPLWVNGDAMRLEQVFDNLLSNASKYSPEGAEISISSREDRGRAIVLVRDNGIGIKHKMLEEIFSPFVRESRASGDGLGIGLTLARNLVTQHGGQITAHSDGPGRGSTFVVSLPLLKHA